jgi:hypothetical protein
LDFLDIQRKCISVLYLAREVWRMPESFGARMRRQRERQQVALATIADQTKIKLSLLDAMERDDVSRWPTGIFRRAFIRAYAHAIGLEPDVVVREFLELYPDPAEVAWTESVIAPTGEGESARMRPPTRFRFLVRSARGSLSHFLRRSSGNEGTPAAAYTPPMAPVPSEPDLSAAAEVCAGLGRIDALCAAAPLLERAAGLLDAVGAIVWVWDPQGAELRPALAYGYSDKVLTQLPKVTRLTDNATAAAFRSEQTCIVNGNALSSGALAVPLMTPTACAGVLSIELPHTSAQKESVRALATIFSTQFARVVGAGRHADDRRLA